MTGQYDVITVGGGLAGTTLAKSLAEHGVSVLVVEQEKTFKDRVRGEQMQPWGVAEARTLGVYDLLLGRCGHEQPWIDMYLGPAQIAHRNLTRTTPQAAPHFNFHHPPMQECLVGAAEAAGAKVRRGASVREVRGGARPVAVIEEGGSLEEIPARPPASSRASACRVRSGASRLPTPGSSIHTPTASC